MTFSENPSKTFANVSSGQTCTLMLKFVAKSSKGTGNVVKTKYRKRDKMKGGDQENSTRMIKS